MRRNLPRRTDKVAPEMKTTSPSKGPAQDRVAGAERPFIEQMNDAPPLRGRCGRRSAAVPPSVGEVSRACRGPAMRLQDAPRLCVG